MLYIRRKLSSSNAGISEDVYLPAKFERLDMSKWHGLNIQYVCVETLI